MWYRCFSINGNFRLFGDPTRFQEFIPTSVANIASALTGLTVTGNNMARK